jgi:DnaJ-class molecular chaperone
MSQTVAVVCADCAGTGDGPDGFCGFCLSQGHISIDRNADGSVPALHADGRPVVEWIAPALPETPINPWVSSNPRCVP